MAKVSKRRSRTRPLLNCPWSARTDIRSLTFFALGTTLIQRDWVSIIRQTTSDISSGVPSGLCQDNIVCSGARPSSRTSKTSRSISRSSSAAPACRAAPRISARVVGSSDPSPPSDLDRSVASTGSGQAPIAAATSIPGNRSSLSSTIDAPAGGFASAAIGSAAASGIRETIQSMGGRIAGMSDQTHFSC